MSRWRSVVVCAMLGTVGCAAGDRSTEPTGAESVDQAFKRTAAARLASVLADASARDQLMSALRERSPLALSELSALIGEIDTTAGSRRRPRGLAPLAGGHLRQRELARGLGALR